MSEYLRIDRKNGLFLVFYKRKRNDLLRFLKGSYMTHESNSYNCE